MRHLEIAVGCVLVADEAEAVRSDGHGGVLTDLASTVQGTEGGGAAGLVRTVGYLEGMLGRVVVADEAEAVGSHGHGSELADVAWAIQGCKGDSLTCKIGIVRSDSKGQSEAQEKPDPQHKRSISGQHDRPSITHRWREAEYSKSIRIFQQFPTSPATSNHSNVSARRKGTLRLLCSITTQDS